MKTNNRLALAGLIFLLPASVLVSSGVLGFTAPSLVIHPVLVMGGLLIALLLNSLSVLRLQIEREQNDGVSAFTLRVANQRFNLAVLVMSVLLLAMIFAYLFVENFRPR
jgi:hypothetical protein